MIDSALVAWCVQKSSPAGGPLPEALPRRRRAKTSVQRGEASCCMIVQMSSEPARRSGRELVKLRQATEQDGCDQSVSARQEQFVARVVVAIIRRRNITALSHGQAANLRLDLSPDGLFVHASSRFVLTASTSLSGVRLGLTGLLCNRWSPAVGRVKSVRRGHDMIRTFH